MTKREELTNTLIDFYKKPVAQVSTELFLTIGAVIFFALFAIRPTLVTMSDLVSELEQKRTLDGQLSQKIASLSSLQGQYVAIQNQAQVLDQAFPNTPDTIYVLKTIEKLASDNRLAITALQISQVPSSSDTDISQLDAEQISRQTFSLSVTVVGEYESIKNFIADLINSRRIMTVEAINFSVQENSTNRQLATTVTISSYYFGTQRTQK